MSDVKTAYTSQRGDFYPAAACNVPAAPAAAALRGASLADIAPQDVKKIHLHVKNLTRTGAAVTAGSLITAGGYSDRRVLAIAFYAMANGEIHLSLTTTQLSGASYGKYYNVIASPSVSTGYYTDTTTQYTWHQNIPSELELLYDNGRVLILVDGVVRIDRNNVLGGTYLAPWPTASAGTVYYNPGWTFDVVDFSYETAKGSLRFVPLKTVDGKDAIYEVYTQQVAEL